MKFVLNIQATVTPVVDRDVIYSYRSHEEWRVPKLDATFEFETAESLYNFIRQYALTLGAKESQ